MKSRIGSYQDQWHSAMGKAVPDFEIFTPTAQKSLDSIQQRAEQGLAKERGGGPATSKAPVRITTDEEWSKLAPGTQFMGPDNVLRVK